MFLGSQFVYKNGFLFGNKFELNMDRKQTTKKMRYYMKILSVYKDHKIQQYDESLIHFGRLIDFDTKMTCYCRFLLFGTKFELIIGNPNLIYLKTGAVLSSYALRLNYQCSGPDRVNCNSAGI